MMDSESYARERQTKQDFLKVEIVDKGYNTADFAQYLLEQRGKSLSINAFKTMAPTSTSGSTMSSPKLSPNTKRASIRMKRATWSLRCKSSRLTSTWATE